MSVFPDGLFQYGGQPVGSRLWASPWSKAYFVDGENGNDNNSGLKPTEALDTIQAAWNKVTRGDVIYIRPQEYTIGSGFTRYTEEVTTTIGGVGGAGGVDMTNADVSIIGCANSTNPEYGVRWKHATDSTGYCLVNVAPTLHVENIGFFAEGAAGAIHLLSNGATDTQRGIDGTTFYNCVIKGANMVVADGGDGLTIQNTRFHCKYDGTVAGVAYTCNVSPGRRFTMRNCEFIEGNGTVASDQFITLTGVITEVVIRDCYFPQVPTGNAYVVAAAGCEGIMANCYFGTADLSTTGIEEGGLLCAAMYDVTGIQTSV